VTVDVSAIVQTSKGTWQGRLGREDLGQGWQPGQLRDLEGNVQDPDPDSGDRGADRREPDPALHRRVPLVEGGGVAVPLSSRAGIVVAVTVAGAVTGRAGRQPPPNYVRAVPLKEQPRQASIVEVPKPLPLPGQLKRVPVPSREPHPGSDKSGPAWEVIDAANRKAEAGPEAEAYFNAIMAYDFASGALYQIYAAPLRLTAIQLQPGEKIVGKPAVGDAIRWIMGVGRSGGCRPGGLPGRHGGGPRLS